MSDNMRYKARQKYLIMPIDEGGCAQLQILGGLVSKHLRAQGATGAKGQNPDHVTIGFMGKKAARDVLPSFNLPVDGCMIRTIELYHWRPSRDPNTNSREEFYPKEQFQV